MTNKDASDRPEDATNKNSGDDDRPIIRVNAPFESEKVETSDGSSTLFHPIYEQTYHSHHGAITESNHVFLGHSQLRERLEDGSVNLLEIGIGTGLNLALSASLAKAVGGTLRYMGIEQLPPEPNALSALRYSQHDDVDAVVWQECLRAFQDRRADWTLESYANIHCHWGRLEDAPLPDEHFDVVYHDAFSPDVNPECWTDDALQNIVHAMRPGGVLVTYTVQGDVRRALAKLGLHVERLPGPPGGKRQVLRAHKPDV